MRNYNNVPCVYSFRSGGAHVPLTRCSHAARMRDRFAAGVPPLSGANLAMFGQLWSIPDQMWPNSAGFATKFVNFGPIPVLRATSGKLDGFGNNTKNVDQNTQNLRALRSGSLTHEPGVGPTYRISRLSGGRQHFRRAAIAKRLSKEGSSTKREPS